MNFLKLVELVVVDFDVERIFDGLPEILPFSILNHRENILKSNTFPIIIIDKKSKEKKTYPYENYMTPYEKLKSIKNVKKYLKTGITLKELDEIAYAMSHTEYAICMQKEKDKIFDNI